ISQTKAEEAEEARKVHATHARIVTYYVHESPKKKSSGRSSKSVVIQDTPSAPQSKPATSKTKLKGAPSLTPQEQEAIDIMQALKESKKTSRRQPGTRGSNKGTGSKPGAPDESIVVSTTLSEGTGAKPGVSDKEKDITEEKDDKDGDVDNKGDDHIRVRKDEDAEMKDVEVEESDKGEEKVTNAVKEEAEKTSEENDDAKNTELPPSSSSLSVSLGFGDQFLKLSSDSSLVSTVKDFTDADVSSLLDIPIQQETPQTHFNCCPLTSSDTYYLNRATNTNTNPTSPITIDAPTIITAAHESNALSTVELRAAKLEKDVSELKTDDHSSEALVKHTTYLIHKYFLHHLPELTKKPTPTAEQEYEKSPSEILKNKKEQAKKQKKPQFTFKTSDKAALEEYDLKTLIEDKNAMDKGVADTVKDHKRKHDDDEDDDDEDPPTGPNQGKKTKRRRTKESESSKKPSSTKETLKGKAPTKGTKNGKSASAKEPVEEPIAEVVMDDVGDDVARDDSQPQDTSEPKTRKTLNPDWFKQPPRPPTPNPE
ncbi:hypothetical protein Tco_0429337, partial [Tanacetum coccineum]